MLYADFPLNLLQIFKDISCKYIALELHFTFMSLL